MIELAIQPDHVHLFVRVWPSESAADVVKELKGSSSFHLCRECESTLKKGPSTWTRSSFACTVGQGSAEGIKAYIDAQKGP